VPHTYCPEALLGFVFGEGYCRLYYYFEGKIPYTIFSVMMYHYSKRRYNHNIIAWKYVGSELLILGYESKPLRLCMAFKKSPTGV